MILAVQFWTKKKKQREGRQVPRAWQGLQVSQQQLSLAFISWANGNLRLLRPGRNCQSSIQGWFPVGTSSENKASVPWVTSSEERKKSPEFKGASPYYLARPPFSHLYGGPLREGRSACLLNGLNLTTLSKLQRPESLTPQNPWASIYRCKELAYKCVLPSDFPERVY